MSSPFPKASSVPGHGTVHLTLLPPSTPSFSSLAYTYPLKLLPSTPHILHRPVLQSSSSRTNDDNSLDLRQAPVASIPEPISPSKVPLLFFLTYGGGLLSGDQVDLTIVLDPSTRLTITTQGSTKIYRPPLAIVPPTITRQDLRVRVGTRAALWLAPDPVQPFAGSRYAQTQIFEVESGGSVGLVDWVSEGRSSRGEKWDFKDWRGKNEIWHLNDCVVEGSKAIARKRLLVRDSVILDGTEVQKRMDTAGIFGTMLLRGPLFEALGRFFIREFDAMPRIGGRDWSQLTTVEKAKQDDSRTRLEKWRAQRILREKSEKLLWTASCVRGVFIVKFSAREVEGARLWLGAMLKEEGTVRKECGDGGLMFVR